MSCRAPEKLFDKVDNIKGLDLVAIRLDNTPVDQIRPMAEMAKDKNARLVCVIACVFDGKITFAAACGTEAVKQGAHAGNILKQVAKIAGGGGGGRPDAASAGGKDESKVDEAVASVKSILEGMI